ncbi:MAG: dihydrodipicolinate reductase, partial [Vicinamibacterales bacterium]
MRPIRVLHVGLGPIGVAALQQVLSSDRFRAVGGVDLDPALIGRDLGAVAGSPRPAGVRIQRDLSKALASTRPDVVVHCTSSSIARVSTELKAILDRRVAIVSTTEELAYPWRAHAPEARRVDARARRAGVAVLGTGVNPGFAMDALPIALTAACSEVSRVRISRVQDARIRRRPFQVKIGAGLTTLEFRRRVRAGTVGHVGIT